MSLDSKELTLSFIEDYQKYEVLWNTNLKGYSNKLLRGDALQKLSKKYAIDVTAVKNKIKNLRSYFSKEHEKTVTKKSGRRGLDDSYISNWFAYKHLLFLKDTNVPLTTKDSIGEEKSNQGNSEQVDGYIDDEDTEKNHSSSPILSTFAPMNEGPRKKRRKSNQPANKTEEREEGAYQLMKSVTANMKTADEYSAFGEFISHKIRKLRSERLRSIAQHRIGNLLFELEMSPENSDACSSDLPTVHHIYT